MDYFRSWKVFSANICKIPSLIWICFQTDQWVLFVFCSEHYDIVFIACGRFNVIVHVDGPTFKVLSQPKVLETILGEMEIDLKLLINF